MKFFKDNWLTILILVAAVFFFWEWQCNPVASPTQDKKQNDSLAKEVQKVEMASSKTIDSLRSDNADLEAFANSAGTHVASLNDSLQMIRDQVAKLKIALQQKPDTIGLIDPSCADLSDRFDSYVEISGRKSIIQDSIITAKTNELRNSDTIISQRENANFLLRQSFATVNGNYNTLYKSFSSQSKKLQWFKVKEKTLFAALLLTGGKILFDSIKK